jgi:hypothetical protein
MRRAVRVQSFAALLLAVVAPLAAAPGSRLEELETALGILPRVDRIEVDRNGHLTLLEGELTPPGPSPPIRAAVAFLEVHARLFSAAEGSVFRAEQVVTSSGTSSVMVRQAVDGFRVVDEQVWLAFDESGVLTRVEGVVLRDGDLPHVDIGRLTRGRAAEIALDWTRAPAGTTIAGSRRVVVDRRRVWEVELHGGGGDEMLATIVTIDDASGGVVGTGRHPIALPRVDLPVAHTPDGGLAIAGCTAFEPKVGEFGSPAGQQLWSWSGGGCGRWEYDPSAEASLLHGNCLEYECDPYPATDPCDHGEIRRADLSLEPGYERARIEALTPDREIFMRLRWGPSRFDAAPFLIPAGVGGSTTVELDLAAFGTWDSSKVTALVLELVDDHLVRLRSLDLLPGPWLELPRGPDLTPAAAGTLLVAGEPVTVLQNVRNTGCRLEEGTHQEMRAVSYDLYRIAGLLRHLEGTVCSGAEIPGSMPPESAVRGLPMCEFDLPAAGTWELEARFDAHPAPSASSMFIVEPAEGPDVAIDLRRPIDLYSGRLAMWPCRADLLDRARYGDPDPPCSLPYVIAFEATASGLTEPATAAVGVWARPRDPVADPTGCDPDSGGWYALADPMPWQFGDGSANPVELPLDRDRALAMPLGSDGWAVVDLKVTIDPVAGEVDVDDNRACIAAWLPVADGEVGAVLGPTWVDDDYFLDPEHWPPSGLTWSGLTLDHEEGSTSYEPDSALAILSVESGANEAPRLVWFEQLEERTVAGLLLRYRRSTAGHGGPPWLDAGCAEDDGLPGFELDVPGHPNRITPVVDGQWRTAAWRRGDAAPFGGFPVPQLIGPTSSGPVLSLHLSPDRNCAIDEPECQSGLHPETMIDVVGIWYADTPPTFEPLFIVEGLLVRYGDEWIPTPVAVSVGEMLEFGVEVRNVGTATGVAVLTAAVEILPINEGPAVHVMTGSEAVPIAPGASYVMALAPQWQPASEGRYEIEGLVWEGGDEIGQVDETIEVLDTGSSCPVPAVSLP